MSIKTWGLITVLASSSVAWAGNFTGKPVGPIHADGTVGLVRGTAKAVGRGRNMSFKKAKGRHQCWSTVEIGRTCDVEGSGYLDCDQAFYALKAMDCCASMNVRIFGQSYSSNSREFRNFTCGSM
jgi:hypothetical protein